jgi:hypothetical protein
MDLFGSQTAPLSDMAHCLLVGFFFTFRKAKYTRGILEKWHFNSCDIKQILQVFGDSKVLISWR